MNTQSVHCTKRVDARVSFISSKFSNGQGVQKEEKHKSIGNISQEKNVIRVVFVLKS